MSPGVKSLGSVPPDGDPARRPEGMPQIEVAFDIDANGIVNVSAKDLATGKEQAMTITGGTALGKDEVERMVQDAEKFAAEDHQRREAAEARNRADQLAYQVEKFVADEGDKIPEADRTELSKKSDELKDILKDEAAEAAALTAAADALMEVFQRVGTAMVQNQQAAQTEATDDAGTGRRGRGSVRGRRGRGRDRRGRRCIVMLTKWDPFRELRSVEDEFDRMVGQASRAQRLGAPRSTCGRPRTELRGDRRPARPRAGSGRGHVRRRTAHDPRTAGVLQGGGRGATTTGSSAATARSRGRSGCLVPPTRRSIEASFDKGVLTVDVPKRDEAKPKTIEVVAK